MLENKRLHQVKQILDLCQIRFMDGELLLSSKKGNKHQKLIKDLLYKDNLENINLFDHDYLFQDHEDYIIDFKLNRDSFLEVFNARFYINITHFLELNNSPLVNDINIYIYEYNSKSILLENDDLLIKYNNYIKLKASLISLSLIENNSEQHLFLIDDDQYLIEFNNGYLIDNSEYVEDIVNFQKKYSSDDTYSEEFKLILKRVLISLLKRNNSKDFSVICENFEEFYNELIKSYHIFLKRFSFEKIKQEFFEIKNKYTDLLDKSLNSIFKLIYSIPIGMGLAILLKFVESNPFFENFVIFISFLLFSITAIILVIHNWNSLEINSKFINNQKLILQEKLGLNSIIYKDDFDSTFRLFDKKIFLTKFLSIILCTIIGVLLVLLLIKILIYSDSINNNFKLLLSYLENKNVMIWFVKFARLMY